MKNVIPATDWFFVHRNDENGLARPTVWHLAAWGVTETGDVVGLVAPSGKNSNGVPSLATVPPVEGQYLHRDQLTDIEREQALKR